MHPNLSRPAASSLRVALLSAALCLPPILVAQVQRPSEEELRQAMQQLDWMVGEWEGSGWIDIAGQGRREFSFTQRVTSRFEGLMIVVEGNGIADDDGSQVHEALRLISGPAPAVLPGPPGTYTWQEISAGVLYLLNEAHAGDRSLRVGLPFGRQYCVHILDDSWQAACRREGGEPIWSQRTISLNDGGEWIETHAWERMESIDDRSWVTYLEIVLRRVDGERR